MKNKGNYYFPLFSRVQPYFMQRYRNFVKIQNICNIFRPFHIKNKEKAFRFINPLS